MTSFLPAGACPSELALDGYLLSGKPAGDPVAAHLPGCARCRARIEEIERQTQAFLRDDFPATLERVLDAAEAAAAVGADAVAADAVAAGAARAGAPSTVPLSAPAPGPVPVPQSSPSKRPFYFLSFFFRPWPVAAAVAGVACLLLGLWLGSRPAVAPGGEARRLEQRAPLVEPPDAYVGLKGGPVWQVWARRGGEIFEVKDGTRLRSGDLVRFAPRLPGPGYLMILSVDGQGGASLFHPHAGGRALDLRPPLSAAALPGSVELDASRGPERFFLLFSTADFEWAAVARAAREGLAAQGSLEALTRLPLADIEQTSLLILKE